MVSLTVKRTQSAKVNESQAFAQVEHTPADQTLAYWALR